MQLGKRRRCRRRRPQTSGGPVKDLATDIVLEDADLLSHRRRRHAELLRCPGKGAQTRRGLERAQGIEMLEVPGHRFI